jgi:hypothetical protein
MPPVDISLPWEWSVQSLDLRDDLNEKIWSGSRSRGASLRRLFPLAGGLQDMGSSPLPWVPDIVGSDWKARADVLVVGSAYSPFFDGAARTATMPRRLYAEAESAAQFIRGFLSYVVAPDHAYYGKLGRLLTGVTSLENTVLTDLARVSFVSLKPDGRFEAGDGAVNRSRAAFDAYVRSGEDWTWRRIQQCPRGGIVTLGSLATTELLGLLVRRGFVPKRGGGVKGGSPARSRNGSVSLALGTWCTAHLEGERYTVAAAYHPAWQNKNDQGWAKSRGALLEAMAAARSDV